VYHNFHVLTREKLKYPSKKLPSAVNAPPPSVNSQAKTVDLIAGEARTADYAFKIRGNGLSKTAVFNDSLLGKAAAIAQPADVEMLIDDSQIIITPPRDQRPGRSGASADLR
jgi:hypothetical protein